MQPRSAAAQYGLRKGDVITSVNRDAVKNINDLKQKMGKSKGKSTALRIERGDQAIYVTIRG